MVLTTIALATMKSFDVVYTMTGGNFRSLGDRQRVLHANLHAEQHRHGCGLAVILFVLILPIVIYNVHSMKISERR